MIGIYKITNMITGKCYIGQSGRLVNRFNGHMKAAAIPSGKQYNDPLYQDMREYGIDSFKFEILETVSLNELEEKWIQSSLNSGLDLYNKDMFPNTRPHNSANKFSDEQLTEIIALLKEDRLSNIQISKKFDCSSSTIDNINNGLQYRVTEEEYPIRAYERSRGDRNPNSLYSDEEVMELRKKFVTQPMSKLFAQYGRTKSLTSFERVITGPSYSHLPIYKKTSKQWFKNDKLYRLEP